MVTYGSGGSNGGGDGGGGMGLIRSSTAHLISLVAELPAIYAGLTGAFVRLVSAADGARARHVCVLGRGAGLRVRLLEMEKACGILSEMRMSAVALCVCVCAQHAWVRGTGAWRAAAPSRMGTVAGFRYLPAQR